MSVQLQRTCHSFPEQYDALIDGRQVGYLRLRNGEFTVEYPDCGGKLIFHAAPHGDGGFEDWERNVYLEAAKATILAWEQNTPIDSSCNAENISRIEHKPVTVKVHCKDPWAECISTLVEDNIE